MEDDLYTNTDDQGFAGNNETLTIEESQATPASDEQYQNQDIQEGNNYVQAPESAGVGAGTARNPYNSINSDDSPLQSRASNQTVVNTSTANLNQLIPTQPNQLDQYASYTYAISWYLLSVAQFNDMMATQKPNVFGWKLLMQSGGAPVTGRSPAFSLDYYMDDLEIDTLIPMGGTQRAHTATDIRFKVVEPNGITLIQSLFDAVSSVYNTAQQVDANASSKKGSFNYLQAHYCLVIEFYGYDKDGNLISPIKGAFNTSAQSSGYGQQAVIVKYYPFRLNDIKFQIANRSIEYTVTGKPIGQSYGFTTDRGTIPYSFTMAGQTVEQLLNGSPVASGGSASTSTADPGTRKTTNVPLSVPITLPSIVTGQDNPLATPDGMDFTPGNF